MLKSKLKNDIGRLLDLWENIDVIKWSFKCQCLNAKRGEKCVLQLRVQWFNSIAASFKSRLRKHFLHLHTKSRSLTFGYANHLSRPFNMEKALLYRFQVCREKRDFHMKRVKLFLHPNDEKGLYPVFGSTILGEKVVFCRWHLSKSIFVNIYGLS